MGTWRLRLIGDRPTRYTNNGLLRHGGRPECDLEGCGYVVEQHQSFGEPEEADVPEFTIEVAYKVANREGAQVIPGWRYILKWKDNGESKQARAYGYEEKEAAIRSAKRRADEVALALRPVHVETYTPEI